MNKESDYLKNALTNVASANPAEAREYLNEEGIDYEGLYKVKMKGVLELVSKHKLAEGAESQGEIKRLFREFTEKIKGLAKEEVIKMYPSIPQAAFSKLNRDKFTEDDETQLLMDASFLRFLESQDSSEPS